MGIAKQPENRVDMLRLTASFATKLAGIENSAHRIFILKTLLELEEASITEAVVKDPMSQPPVPMGKPGADAGEYTVEVTN